MTWNPKRDQPQDKLDRAEYSDRKNILTRKRLQDIVGKDEGTTINDIVTKIFTATDDAITSRQTYHFPLQA